MPVQSYLSPLGMPGLTAYVGVNRIAEVRAGDVVFVSPASGAVGAVACQIAKPKGAHVIGSVGGPENRAFLKEIGVATDYN